KRFISGKYGLFNRWTTEEVMGTFGCSVWKTIRRLWTHFKNNICISVGDGRKTQSALNDCEIEEVAKLLGVLNDFLSTS
ncbi:hypothetical protein H5410_055481, partial [Solanum commersonii]